MSEEEKFAKKTESEVTIWRLAGRTAPFVAMAGFICCAFLAKEWLTIYAVLVITCWVTVSVAWWWWALHKILRLIGLMLSTKVKFDEVKTELRSIKNDMGNRKRRESNKD